MTTWAKDIIERSGARWSIEVTNRETKILLGAAEPKCRKGHSVIRAPMFVSWSYTSVVLWFVRQFSAAKNLVAEPALWHLKKKDFTFSDMPAAARRSHLRLRTSSKASETSNVQKSPNRAIRADWIL